METATVEELTAAMTVLDNFKAAAIAYNDAVQKANAIAVYKAQYAEEYAKVQAITLQAKPADKEIAMTLPVLPSKVELAGKTGAEILVLVKALEAFEKDAAA